jgi:hypothetical protein
MFFDPCAAEELWEKIKSVEESQISLPKKT